MMRGSSLVSRAFIQRFRRLRTVMRDVFACADCEIRPGNARTRLYSADFRPTDTTQIKATVLGESLSIIEDGDDTPEVVEWLMEATNPDLI